MHGQLSALLHGIAYTSSRTGGRSSAQVQGRYALHGLLKAAGLLPEQPLPGGEVGALEQCVLQDTLNTTQRLCK